MNEADRKAFEDALACMSEGFHAFPPDHIAQAFWQAACEWRDSQVGEPVAWMSPNKERIEFSTKSTVYGSHTIPLYTTPPTAQINQQLVEALERLINAYSVSHSPETRANCWEQAKSTLQAAKQLKGE